MSSAPAAPRVRLRVPAALASVVAAGVLAGSAGGTATAPRPSLAPAGACPGAADPVAPAARRIRALRCLVNRARARHRRGRLTTSRALQRAAVLKGRGVIACRQISHTPCGADATASVRSAGYEFTSFAENLYAGGLGAASPRDVVAAWLQSPAHRAAILHPRFRELGVATVRADGVFAEGPALVWIAAFGSQR